MEGEACRLFSVEHLCISAPTHWVACLPRVSCVLPVRTIGYERKWCMQLPFHSLKMKFALLLPLTYLWLHQLALVAAVGFNLQFFLPYLNQQHCTTSERSAPSGQQTSPTTNFLRSDLSYAGCLLELLGHQYQPVPPSEVWILAP